MRLFILISGLFLTNAALASSSKNEIIECKRVIVIIKHSSKKVIFALPNVVKCQKK